MQGEKRTLDILIADDDSDDIFLFEIALKGLSIPFRLSSVHNGQQLIDYLATHTGRLPDVLVLDLNMPLKNGSECIVELKRRQRTKRLPIIVYSTSLHDDVADVLYHHGAHYYLRKTDIAELLPPLRYALTKLYNRELDRPPRNRFVLNPKQLRYTR
ncbi:MAG TPA: response regulator [Chitinophagaceae bacterium]|nr:response regulator [Chitinophagaceae bacterium]